MSKKKKNLKDKIKDILNSYKTIIYVSFLINISLLIILYNVVSNNNVYTFSGSDEYVEIKEGLVVLNTDINLINGSKIKYINSEDYEITSYKIGYYVMDNQKLIEIVSTSSDTETPISLKDIIDSFLYLNVVEKNSSNIYFTKYKKNLLKDGLYFVIEAKTIDGDSILNKLKLNVTKISKH